MTIDEYFERIAELTKFQTDCREQDLVKIITEYDFIVGSEEVKRKLLEVLPEGAKIICSPYIVSPATIFAIKKFDIRDCLYRPGNAIKIHEHIREEDSIQ